MDLFPDNSMNMQSHLHKHTAMNIHCDDGYIIQTGQFGQRLYYPSWDFSMHLCFDVLFLIMLIVAIWRDVGGV